MLIESTCHFLVPPLVPLGGADTVRLSLAFTTGETNLAPSDPPPNLGRILGAFVLLGGHDPLRNSAQSSSGDR